MNDKRKNIVFRQLVLILLLVLVSIIFLESCFYLEYKNSFLPNSKRDAALCVVPGVILLSGMLLILFNRIDRIKCENEKKVSGAIWCIIFLLQAVILYLLIKGDFKGITDTARVINEAIAMLDTQQGRINNEAAYFARYGNNYPFTILIYYICKIVRFFGFRCYTAVLMFLNIILIDIAGMFALKLMKLLRGNTAGIKFLFLFMISPTPYIWILYTYTNTFSMPFITGLLYYGIRAMRMDKHRMGNIMLAAVIGAVGYQIRATTIIPLIAVILGIFLAAGIRRRMEKGLMVLLIIGIFVAVMLMSSCFCRQHLENREQDMTFPFTHWVMMGLNSEEKGVVNKRDVKFTISKPTRQEKISANLAKIRKRLQKMGPAGYAELIVEKMKMVWAFGDDGIRRFYANGENISGIHSYTFGDKGGFFTIYCQIFRSVAFLFVLLSIFSQIRRKGAEEFFVISLALLGAILFLILWETNRKYNLCFMTLVYILMGDGISRTLACVQKADTLYGICSKRYCRWGIRLFFLLVPSVISFFMAKDYPYYLQEKSGYHETVISNVSYKEENRVLKKRGDMAEQTFIINRSFNEIGIMSRNEKIDEDSYRIQILDENENPVPIRNISTEQIYRTGNYWLIFHLDNINSAENPAKYTIRMKCLKNNKTEMSFFVTPFDTYDLYTGGALWINSRLSKRDMAFRVFYRKEERLIGTDGYVIFGLAIWSWSFVLCLFFGRKPKKNRYGVSHIVQPCRSTPRSHESQENQTLSLP